MCSQELRLDLELFLNRALQYGWPGWPLKTAQPLLSMNKKSKGPALSVVEGTKTYLQTRKYQSDQYKAA